MRIYEILSVAGRESLLAKVEVEDKVTFDTIESLSMISTNKGVKGVGKHRNKIIRNRK
jgi:hypothetical protein